MGNQFYYLVFCCVANLAFSAAETTSNYGINPSVLRNDSFRWKELDTMWVLVEPPRASSAMVDNYTREIHIRSGALFEDSGFLPKMFEKYFNGSSLEGFNFIGNDFATFKPTSVIGQYALNIAPLEPGVYTFEYEGFKEGQSIRYAWTVHSLRSHFIRRNSFFEISQNVTRREFDSWTEIKVSPLVRFRRHGYSSKFYVYGFADVIQDSSILNIQMNCRKEHWNETLTKIWLRVEEPESQESSEKHLDFIQVWIDRFERTFDNKWNLARCLAEKYGVNHTDFEEVHFDYTTEATVFKAQFPNRGPCKQLLNLSRYLMECPFSIYAYNLTCHSGEGWWGPRDFFYEISNFIGDNEIKRDSPDLATVSDAPIPEIWFSDTKLLDDSETSARLPADVSTSKPARLNLTPNCCTNDKGSFFECYQIL